MSESMPENWVMFIAERDGRPIACSLIAVSADQTPFSALNHSEIISNQASAAINNKVAYGRYWGALERVDSLHFEACYYQPIAWCIANGYGRFEGGAQGEHKWPAPCCPWKHPAHTGWLTRPLPMPLPVFWSAKAKAWPTICRCCRLTARCARQGSRNHKRPLCSGPRGRDTAVSAIPIRKFPSRPRCLRSCAMCCPLAPEVPAAARSWAIAVGVVPAWLRWQSG